MVQFNAVNTFSASMLAIVTSTLNINRMGFYIKDLEEFVNLPRIVSKQGEHIERNQELIFEFRNVSFKYPGAQDFSLKDINMKFSSKEKISFVGINGAGKTTVIKLLLRLYDVDSGEILLNNKNIKEFDWKEYINIFSTVFQDFKLFAYSVKENIILDEPASALDPLAEYDLYTNINNLVYSKGCIFISHRLSSTLFADKIFVFNNGCLVEHGSHSELMENEKGLYKEMFEKQSSYYKVD